MHLCLCGKKTAEDDVVHANSASSAIRLLQTGAVTEISFGESWNVSAAHCGLICSAEKHCEVACYIRMAVSRQIIPKPSWDVMIEDAGAREVITKIMRQVDEICRLRAKIIEPWAPNAEILAEAGLDPDLDFDRFVIGEANVLAWTRAKAMAILQKTNPLLIHGETGLGKTHLLHSIGYQLIKDKLGINVLCLGGEEVLNAARLDESGDHSRSNRLAERCRYLDVLLLDSTQCFEGNPIALKIANRVVRALFERRKPLVLTATAFPLAKMGEFGETLSARLSTESLVEVKRPDSDLRTEILQLFLSDSGMKFPVDVARLVVDSFAENIRELLQAARMIADFGQAYGREVDMTMAREWLASAFPPNSTIAN